MSRRDPYRAFLESKIKLAVPLGVVGRKGIAVELSSDYFRDAVMYCAAAEQEALTPSLFDLLALEKVIAEAAGDVAEAST